MKTETTYSAGQVREAEETNKRSRIKSLANSTETMKAVCLATAPPVLYFSGAYWYDETLYKPETGLGYYLGLVGGVMMLLAYLYSMRKHLRMLRFTGLLSYWLRIHIFFGIVGPFLIILHTGFSLESPNATGAFIAMAFVFYSGIVGRYLYSKVHFGLDGRRAHLLEITQLLGLGDDKKTLLTAIPEIKNQLNKYEILATEKRYGVLPALRALVLVRFGTSRLHRDIRRDLRRYLLPFARAQQWDANTLNRVQQRVLDAVKEYIAALRTVVRFRAYDQLFMLWRMLHVPLLFLLFSTGVFHVVYVHMMATV